MSETIQSINYRLFWVYQTNVISTSDKIAYSEYNELR